VWHAAPHAVPIGDDVWFGYLTTRTTSRPLGFGHFDGDTYNPSPRSVCTSAAHTEEQG